MRASATSIESVRSKSVRSGADFDLLCFAIRFYVQLHREAISRFSHPRLATPITMC